MDLGLFSGDCDTSGCTERGLGDVVCADMDLDMVGCTVGGCIGGAKPFGSTDCTDAASDDATLSTRIWVAVTGDLVLVIEGRSTAGFEEVCGVGSTSSSCMAASTARRT